MAEIAEPSMHSMPINSTSFEQIPNSISVDFLPDSEKISSKALNKGLNYYTQGYIHEIKFSLHQNIVTVSAKCWPSMRKNNPPHKLNMDVSDTSITDSFCSCTAGTNGKCSHVIGLIKTLQGLKLHNFKEVPDQQSCTSIPQQWHKPRGSKIVPVPVNHLTVARAKETRKRKPVTCQLDLNYKLPKVTEKDMDILAQLKGTPLQSRISPATPKVSTPFGEVQLGCCISYQTNKLKQPVKVVQQLCGDTCVTGPPAVPLPEEFKVLNINTKCDDPKQLELDTKEQSSSNIWFQERAKRLTASNFGLILYRKAAPTEKFLTNLFRSGSVIAKSLKYGKRNEKKAKERYLYKFPSRHIHETGLVVNNEFSFLGATPDGLVCDDGQCGLLEVKCPYSARNMTVGEACQSVPHFYLNKGPDDVITLNETHNYYAQVQGQLMVTGCKFCDFVVFTSKDMHVQRILPDTIFMTGMLKCLSQFYRDHALPYLQKTQQ